MLFLPTTVGSLPGDNLYCRLNCGICRWNGQVGMFEG